MMQHTPSRPRALAAVLIVTMLALGAVAGIAFDRLVLLPRTGYAGEVTPQADTSRMEGMGPRGPGAMGGRVPGDRYLRHLADELDLTEEQRARIDAILTDQQERVLEITRESRPRIREVAADTRAAIRDVLTPEQQARLEELRQQRDRRGGHHGGGPGERMRDTLPRP
jgi:Spy/CpxP family protein refolding chaperone